MARLCARPDCSQPAVATLSYDYGARTAWVDELSTEATPNLYDMCAAHADRLRVPVGWERADRRRGAAAAGADGAGGERHAGEPAPPDGPTPGMGMRLAV